MPPDLGKAVILSQIEVERLRTAGNRFIVPDDHTRSKMYKAGLRQMVVTFKMCLAASGKIRLLQLLKSSGYPEYDRKIVDNMLTWRYRPYVLDGKAVPVCTSVTFIYRMIRE